MKEHLVKIKLSDVKPNPNRDLAFNPYNEEKIAALMASIGETGFWTNVIVRQSPDGKGYEQAYGHHRIESAQRCGIKEADFVVRDLDENMMLKMMELENQEDYRYCPLSLLETCKAVVNALAAGRIAPFHSFEKVSGVTNDRGYWKVQVYLNGVKKHVGQFPTKEEAMQAYKDAPKDFKNFREAPSFAPVRSASHSDIKPDRMYTAKDISVTLGRALLSDIKTALETIKKYDTEKEHRDTASELLKELSTDKTPVAFSKAKSFLTTETFVAKEGDPIALNLAADNHILAALDALYLLEVKAIKTSDIKEMNWSQLGKFVADIKQRRERIILRETHTKEEIVKINAESARLQAEQKERERKADEEHKALVKKLAEAKREEDTRKAKEIRDRLDAQDEATAKAEETFKEKNKVLDAKVQQVKQNEQKAKEQDKYLPIRKEADRIVHKLERRDEEEEIKALARRPLNANDRERLRQSALKLGEWYNTWVADLFLPPLSTKSSLAEYSNREEAKRRSESKGENK